MKLKIKESKIVNIVRYQDLEDFITEAYDLKSPYEFACIEELSNDSIKKYIVYKQELDSYDLNAIEKLKSGEPQAYITDVLLTDLCNRGWLDSGEYLIEVSW